MVIELLPLFDSLNLSQFAGFQCFRFRKIQSAIKFSVHR